MYTYVIQANSLTFVVNGEAKTIERSHHSYEEVRDALFAENFERAAKLLNIGATIEEYSQGAIKVANGVIYYEGEPIHNAVCARILEMLKERQSVRPLVNFLQRLMRNPSKNSVDQLYIFLEHKNIPIDEDGYILAYKSVRPDYKDYYSGMFDNSPGTTHEMLRNKVSDDASSHCSYGFHVGSLGYVATYGGSDRKIVIVRVDPENVVSVPNDHNCQKMRVTKYHVVKDYAGPLPSTLYKEDVNLDDYDDDDYDDYDESDDDDVIYDESDYNY